MVALLLVLLSLATLAPLLDNLAVLSAVMVLRLPLLRSAMIRISIMEMVALPLARRKLVMIALLLDNLANPSAVMVFALVVRLAMMETE